MAGRASVAPGGQAGARVLCVGLTPAVQRILQFRALLPGEVNRATAVLETVGGKGASVARALARLGSKPLLTGFNGGDTGARIAARLSTEGVEFAFARTAAPTRICQTLLCGETGQVTELVEEAAPPSAGEWASLFALFDRLLAEVAWVAISGHLPSGSGLDTYARLAARAAAFGVPLLIDSSGEPLLQALRHGPAIAKLNSHELGLTFGATPASEAELVKKARMLLAHGAQAVVVTQGADGVWLVEPDAPRALHFLPPAVQAVNPVGSGDAVSAGIIHARLRGAPLEEAVRWGVACGAANAQALGQGEFSLGDVQQLVGRVRITEQGQVG